MRWTLSHLIHRGHQALARSLREELRKESKRRKLDSLQGGQLLKDYLNEKKDAEFERRLEHNEMMKRAKDNEREKQRLKDESTAAAKEQRRLCIEAASNERQQIINERLQKERNRIYDQWLAQSFAADLANQLIGMSAPARSTLSQNMKKAAAAGWFDMPLDGVPLSMWEAVDPTCVQLGKAKSVDDGPNQLRKVKCSLAMEGIIHTRIAPPHLSAAAPAAARSAAAARGRRAEWADGHDAGDLFASLLEKCIPHHRLAFKGSYSARRLLHANDYIVDKAFACAIIRLSKWLSCRMFPQGIFGTWPPEEPAAVKAAMANVK